MEKICTSKLSNFGFHQFPHDPVGSGSGDSRAWASACSQKVFDNGLNQRLLDMMGKG